jgi:NAD(P)-dependent dehydrogenase (short-subunit alcohol dehydrogenase family)
VDVVVERIKEEFGHLDIAINNAGIGDAIPALETSVEFWERIHAINLRGVLICVQREARLMEHQGGTIINVASISGMIVNRDVALAAYAASKAGVIQLTRSLAAEFAPLGIRVNSISPGYIATEMNRKSMENRRVYEAILGQIPMGRFGEPQEVAAAIVFLVSPSCGFMTGMNLVVDGGYTTW